MAKEVHKILPVLLKKEDVETISKIVKDIPEPALTADIISFVSGFINRLNEETEMKQAVAAHNIVFECLKRAEEELDTHDELVRHKGKILVGIEEKCLQHRKRRVRQSGRKVFSELNMLK